MPAFAHVDGRLATRLLEVRHDFDGLDTGGFWIVCVSFEGDITCARFGDVRAAPLPAATWAGPARHAWTSSLDRLSYLAGVEAIRELIAAGTVYQVNLCRVLSAPTHATDLLGLAAVLAAEHPSRYPAVICLPSVGLQVCSASPELFLSRNGKVVETRPIKGTGRTAADITAKDWAENVMIVDLARNDLSRVAATGRVAVPALCEVEEYPGLVHLVSTVRAELADGTTWSQLFEAAFPPASVTGAPKSSALRVIADLEAAPRGPYCGAIGWVDADRDEAALAVGIRTFWLDGGQLKLGTGAGITWDSKPEAEWAETELKADLLLAAASNSG
jgi:para-aminobenzoate synthetase component I